MESESQVSGDGRPRLPRRREPNLAGLATFTLDAAGRVATWSLTATRVFGHPVGAVAGRHVCDVLLTSPGQRQLADQALAEVAAGRVWTATLPLESGPIALRCEPLVGAGPGALVIAQVAAQQPDPGWLSEAAARIGTTLDLSTTANEAVDVAVPGFADAAAIFVAERLLVADEFASPRAGHGAVLRRLAARLSGHPAAVTEDLLRPGEVLVFAEGSPSYRAMTTSTPMLFDQLDDETAERIARHPGGEDLVGSFTSFLAVPLVARGAVLGCATFGRASSSSPFGPADIAAAGELASRAAVCIDNARLYDRERRTAQALQRGMLPGQPDVPATMEVARCYIGVGGSVVGGDSTPFPFMWNGSLKVPPFNVPRSVTVNRRCSDSRSADAELTCATVWLVIAKAATRLAAEIVMSSLDFISSLLSQRSGRRGLRMSRHRFAYRARM